MKPCMLVAKRNKHFGGTNATVFSKPSSSLEFVLFLLSFLFLVIILQTAPLSGANIVRMLWVQNVIRLSLAAVTFQIDISRRTKPSRPKVLLLCLISLCGDVEVNPGPDASHIKLYPCSICREEVTDDDAAISCDQCNLWTHAMCANISDAEYDHLLTHDSFEWKCPICDLSTLTDNQYCRNVHQETLTVKALELTPSFH